jgi:hypothetical protein
MPDFEAAESEDDMLSNEEKWQAIEDMRTRHKELVALIYLTDKQALSLLGLYLTAGTAAASAAFAGIGPNAVVPLSVSAALSGAAATLFLGGVFCFFAMKAADVGLAGRGAEFWKWAEEPDITFKAVFDAYVDNLHDKTTKTRALNTKMARTLSWGKLCGLLAPGIATIVGAIAFGCGY